MTEALAPIHREIVVPADATLAFEVFTDDIGRWWPLDELSVHGPGTTVAFTEGQIVETAPNGEESVWGTVTRWEPGAAVAFTWHPGRDPDAASAVTVTFSAAEDGTLVVLEHSGWEEFDDPMSARAEYEHGWPEVLVRYLTAFQRADEPGDDDTWVALGHRAGALVDGAGSVFEDPRFGEHIAFLQRMHAAGYLVAAGSLADGEGEGMTILRLPGPDRLAEATRLATQDDQSVVGGLFTVTVRPWLVALHA